MGQFTQLELPFHALFAGGSESSTAGTFAPGSEWSWEWKVQLLRALVISELRTVNWRTGETQSFNANFCCEL